MIDPRDSERPEGQPDSEALVELRDELHRLRMQLVLVEVLYLRLVALQARRLADPELEHELAPEIVNLESELARARNELQRRGISLSNFTPPHPGPNPN